MTAQALDIREAAGITAMVDLNLAAVLLVILGKMEIVSKTLLHLVHMNIFVATAVGAVVLILVVSIKETQIVLLPIPPAHLKAAPHLFKIVMARLGIYHMGAHITGQPICSVVNI